MLGPMPDAAGRPTLLEILRAGVLPERLQARLELPGEIQQVIAAAATSPAGRTTHVTLVFEFRAGQGFVLVAGQPEADVPSHPLPPLGDRFGLLEVD